MSPALPIATTDVSYRTIAVNAIDLFYREAGPVDGPTVVLLHGWPASSHMFRDLIPKLADRFHVVAPDYPGFGFSSQPSTSEFAYTFDNLANLIDAFIDALGITKLSMYVQDYGGPIGMRVATRRPELIRAIVVQNANFHVEGISDALAPLAAYWSDQSPEVEAQVRGFLTLDTTTFQYTHGVQYPERVSKDAIALNQLNLDRPGNDAIQLALFRDYESNLKLYPAWQAYLRTQQPPMLVIFGKNDPFFTPAGAEAIGRDNANATIVPLEGGHFALEEHSTQIAAEMRALADRIVAGAYSK
jgi:pimeloyl-ACP methyl ester carboxylesterase